MKKHLFPLCACLILWACTNVKDFGAYWDRGVVDPALAGTWTKVGRPGEKIDDTPGAQTLVFSRNGPSYAMQMQNAGASKEENDAAWAVRTLKIGSGSFLMMKGKEDQPDGIMEKYELHGEFYDVFYLDGGEGVDFLEAKHPTATNITRNRGEGRYLEINLFDDEVFRIMSEIADDPKFWSLQCRYRSEPPKR